MEPTLYIQSCNGYPIWDFCFAAKEGAEICKIPVKSFEVSFEITGDPYNIIVGSVEQCREWLEENKFDSPKPIDISLFEEYLGRESKVIQFSELENESFPVFVKPNGKIKAFTGFVCKKYKDYFWYSEQYEGELVVQSVVDIVSEYRCFIRGKKIVGLQYYSGDFLQFPSSSFILACVEYANSVLDLHSYILDFGLTSRGSTILIEPNDGRAVGHYGLDSKEYYLFVRDRWLQLTGIRK